MLTAIHLGEAGTGREVRSFPGGNVGWPSLFFTADGQTLLAAGEKITGYDTVSGKVRYSWRMKPVPDTSGVGIAIGGKAVDPDSRQAWRGFALSSDGTRIAVTLNGGFGHQPLRDRLALFDARTGKLLRRWSDSGQPGNGFEQLQFSWDGALLASSDREVVHLWEAATGQEISTFRGHRGEIEHLAFRRDDRRLASASSDSTVLIWDTTGQPESAAQTEAKRKQCWDDLAGDDSARAHRAVWNLVRAGSEAVALLQSHLHPVPPIDREQMERWIADLDADAFAVRQKAAAELEKHGELIEPELRRVLANKPALEQRRRIELLLARLEAKSPSGEALRALRAVRVLEHIESPQARRLLRELAGGAEGASLTQAAQAALARRDRPRP